MTPKRIQRQRTRGWRMPKGAVSVSRPSIFGNPFVGLPSMAVAAYREWLQGSLPPRLGVYPMIRLAGYWRSEWLTPQTVLGMARADLRGKDLACWCRLCDAHAAGKPRGVECADCAPCHADVLLELANRQVGQP